MSKPIIKIEGLSKKYNLNQIGTGTLYGDLNEFLAKFKKEELNMRKFDQKDGVHWALKDINLDVYHGDVVGVVGKNGAGKSTILKILSRITSPLKDE